MLPINFHKTFVPERRLIAAILEYARKDQKGTFQEIGKDTGIPMGKSSGKVPAILDYASGMNLIRQIKKGGGVRKPVLTPLGEIVLKEDPFLSESMTQWIAHMNLCRSDIGASAWHEAFAKGRSILGSNFTEEQLESYLVGTFGIGKKRTGPMLSMYSDVAAFQRAGVLEVSRGDVNRKKAPIMDAYALAYSAQILTLMETFFPEENQVTIADFNRLTYWFDISLWSQMDMEHVLARVEGKGYVAVDRQMQPWIIEKMAASEEVWPCIYDDFA